VDDLEPSVVYSAKNWLKNGIAEEYNNTTSCTSIAVYGTLGDTTSPASSTYIIDDLVTTTFTAPDSMPITYGQLLYQSPSLEYGEHSLTIQAETNPTTFFI
ncbi:hypothetical protein PUNSTDRAFT_31719, partial [Punctularia strigosozonata HHB-11173 SS5]|uniref:uncharacterized protein n=1 Tax=Punctularia strigosozonata (strain HHB-11173) TaxID=741275 RepID=UPI0004417BAA